jgi:uncharacterized phage protein (TIGR01671 family)
MNRKILFRGKCVPDSKYAGEWVTGGYVPLSEGVTPRDEGLIMRFIGGNSTFTYHVDPDTVGQYTGIKDRHGNKVFEGDIVRKRDLTFGLKFDGVVVYNSEIGCFRIHSENNGVTMRMGFEASDVYNDGKCTVPIKYEYEVVGNRYDNPELLSID